ncbi:gephyrin-like molybdotransferase Glp [uncultured Maribacter sp.]|uniref:molybdopterin molybdotransferase MoeA n=1 Tax=uncultured Maribacter sp. TaxID=431308 RepID=UPI00262B4AEF|nr:gephyrin-like molybdotransferase Glp [uncultured Maribacter sp.]
MISVSKAKEEIAKYSVRGNEVVVPLEEALGYTLSEAVVSPINMPPFRQSAMDGYALNLTDDLHYKLIGEVQAGDGHNPVLKPGEAIRIFTGAAVPDTANAVVMQEKVVVNAQSIIIEEGVSLEINIRKKGGQVQKGDIALENGTTLNPAGIGYLASLGITEVTVYEKPSIAIVTTGNELCKPGESLTYGKIYESNSAMLATALCSLHIKDYTINTVKDNYKATLQLLQEVISTNDIVIITGGISVGDYDFVGKALKELKVEQLFYKVKQKPGKPLFYGKQENTRIFALPGNPAAALSCFYMYVYPALQKFIGATATDLPQIKANSLSAYSRKGDRAHFLKAIYKDASVEILDGQSSAMLQTFALANALVYVPETKDNITQGEEIDVICLPV